MAFVCIQAGTAPIEAPSYDPRILGAAFFNCSRKLRGRIWDALSFSRSGVSQSSELVELFDNGRSAGRIHNGLPSDELHFEQSPFSFSRNAAVPVLHLLP